MKKLNLLAFDALCKKVAEQTDENDHTGAKLEVSKFFGLKYYIRIFEFVEFLHNADGSLFEDLSSIRLREGKKMMNYLRYELTEKQFSQLNNSF